MYKDIAILLIGIIIGMVSWHFITRPLIGDKYSIDADIKNKKGNMKDNVFEGLIDAKTPKKKRKLFRNIFTKKKKDENK